MKSTDFENFYKLWNTANTCLNPNYKCVNDSMGYGTPLILALILTTNALMTVWK